jgi:hypothetical protein
MFILQSMMIVVTFGTRSKYWVTFVSISPLPLNPKLYTSRPIALPSTFVQAAPGRETTPPCVIDVPYTKTEPGTASGTAGG